MGSFETPPPKQGISNPFRGMGGGGDMDIFWNYTCMWLRYRHLIIACVAGKT